MDNAMRVQVDQRFDGLGDVVGRFDLAEVLLLPQPVK
jgi:hypothetical protein